VRARVQGLSRRADALPKRAGFGPLAGVVGGLMLLLWKFKSLLFGLTKLSTLLSMFVAFAAYWALWGAWFALGFVIAIYIHEMGHVVALSRRGIAASAPMFIPGLGAFVRLNQYPIDVRENARVGLAGPVWGTAAAVLAWAVSLQYGGIWVGLARATAWLNLFNLLPLGGLDGGRGISALSTAQRWLVAATMIGMWILTSDPLLVVLALATAFRASQKDAPAEGDARACIEFIILIGVLGMLCTLPLPMR
jgi:Zn-dependent protease